MKKTAIILFLISLFMYPGCGSGKKEPVRLLLLGLDGLEWSVLLPLLEQGDLPNIRSLMERGSYGQLNTLLPTLSPAIWTTVATGKLPEKHGIEHFVWKDDENRSHLYTTNMRRSKAFWNILSEEGFTVNVIGWWITYPAEKINGVMVSQYISADQVLGVWKGTFKEKIPGQVYPAELFSDLQPFIKQSKQSLDQTIEKYFGTFEKPVVEPETALLEDSKWTLLADDIYYHVARSLLKSHPASLVSLYLGGTDVVAHRFWRYMEPHHYSYPISPDGIYNFKNMILDYYRAVDGLIGTLLADLNESCTVIILSDHGMQPTFFKKPDFRQNSAHHKDAPPGVFIAAGPAIARGDYAAPPGHRFPLKKDLPTVGKVADVAPTLLYLYDLPAALDMDGSIMTKLFRQDWLEAHQPRYSGTYETGTRTDKSDQDFSTPVDDEMIDRLIDLGYIQ